MKPTDQAGRPTCRSHKCQGPRKPRPSRRTLGRYVSRQVLVELRSYDSRGRLVSDVQHWLRYTAPSFPGSKFIPAILGTVVFVYGGLVFIRGAWGELADLQARHDDAHQPGDHSCLWYVARRNIRPLRGRGLVGTRISDHDHGPRPLAGNASYFPGSWRAQCTRGAPPGHCRTCKWKRDSNRSNF